MDVIGHHDMGKRFAAISLEVVKSVDHDLAMRPIAEQTLAVTFIEHGFELSETATFKLVPSGGKMSRKTAFMPGEFELPSFGFATDFIEHGSRNRISESEGGQVTGSRKPPVGQMTCVLRELLLRNRARRIKADKVPRQRDMGWNSPRHGAKS